MGNKGEIKGIEQGRAEFAYKCASEGNLIDKKKEYKAYVKKVPALIKMNGLGATFAFIKSKSSDDENKAGYAYALIYKQTAQWLKKDGKKLLDINDEDKLVGDIISLKSPEYRAVTNEVLAFFNWLRRFAEGLIKEDAKK